MEVRPDDSVDPGSRGVNTPLRSQYADDPEMKHIVGVFVEDLQRRMDAMGKALAEDDIEALRVLSHQLRGAAGGYGFPTIGEHAGVIEDQILAEEVAFSNLVDLIEDLIRLCNLASKPDC